MTMGSSGRERNWFLPVRLLRAVRDIHVPFKWRLINATFPVAANVMTIGGFAVWAMYKPGGLYNLPEVGKYLEFGGDYVRVGMHPAAIVGSFSMWLGVAYNWVRTWTRIGDWFNGRVPTWDSCANVDIFLGKVWENDRINEDLLEELEDVDGIFAQDREVFLPKMVRKYVNKIQLEVGVLKETMENELVIRNKLRRMYKEDSVRDADAFKYTDVIIQLCFTPQNRMLETRLRFKASRAVALRKELHSAMAPQPTI